MVVIINMSKSDRVSVLIFHDILSAQQRLDGITRAALGNLRAPLSSFNAAKQPETRDHKNKSTLKTTELDILLNRSPCNQTIQMPASRLPLKLHFRGTNTRTYYY